MSGQAQPSQLLYLSITHVTHTHSQDPRWPLSARHIFLSDDAIYSYSINNGFGEDCLDKMCAENAELTKYLVDAITYIAERTSAGSKKTSGDGDEDASCDCRSRLSMVDYNPDVEEGYTDCKADIPFFILWTCALPAARPCPLVSTYITVYYYTTC
jgi:hypothetical protein